MRFLINVGMRMGYTFLPALARGAGISVGAMSIALSARELTALSAPFTGKASDRFGPLTVMAVSGLVAATGLLVVTIGAPGLVVGLLVFGFGRTAHQVALNSWIGNVVAYERRGRATGLIELTWGGAALIGLPVAGLLIGVHWTLPFLVLAVLALGLSLRIRTHESRMSPAEPRVRTKPRMTRAAVAAVATNGAMAGAAQFIFLGHGLWLEDTYGLDANAIGFAIVAVGVVEVIATTASSRLTDRIGKRWSIVAGCGLMTGTMLVLAVFSAPPLWVGLCLLAIAFLGFEFGIVSAIPLISELDPNARAEMVGRAISFTTVVRAVVTLVATSIYVSSGFGVLMAVAAAAGAVAVLLATFVMVEPA